MTKKTRMKRLKAGDVFEFEVSPSQVAIGQVLIPGVVFYTCVFEQLLDVHYSDLPDLSSLPIALVGWTTGEEFNFGTWSLVGNQPPRLDAPKPCHKVNTPQGLAIHDFDGKFVRLVMGHDEAFYPYKQSISGRAFIEDMKAIARGDSPRNSLSVSFLQKRVC